MLATAARYSDAERFNRLPECIEEFLDYGTAVSCAFNSHGTLLASEALGLQLFPLAIHILSQQKCLQRRDVWQCLQQGFLTNVCCNCPVSSACSVKLSSSVGSNCPCSSFSSNCKAGTLLQGPHVPSLLV